MHSKPTKLKARCSPEQHPLDTSFEDYVEHVWVAEVAPSLTELAELSREATLRSVFFDSVLGKLSSYAGPVVALAGGTLAGLPRGAQAALAAGTPLANAFGGVVSERRLLARHDFYFLDAVERRLKRG